MEKFWNACLERFKSELTAQQFNTWIKPLRLEPAGDTFALVSPSPFVMLWIKDRFLPRIEEMAEEFFGKPVNFDLVSADSTAPGQKAPAAAPAAHQVAGKHPHREQE